MTKVLNVSVTFSDRSDPDFRGWLFERWVDPDFDICSHRFLEPRVSNIRFFHSPALARRRWRSLPFFTIGAGPPAPGQLRDDQLVRRPDQRRELAAVERLAELLLLDPHVPRHVRRRNDARPLDQLTEHVGCALECNRVRRLQVNHGKHPARHAEAEIVTPLDVLGDVRKRATDRSHRVEGHFAATSRAMLPHAEWWGRSGDGAGTEWGRSGDGVGTERGTCVD